MDSDSPGYADRFAVDWPPELLGLARDGHVAFRHQGHLRREQLLEDLPKLRGELLVAVQDQKALAAQESVVVCGEVASDLRHELAVGVRRDTGYVRPPGLQVDEEEDVVGLESLLPSRLLL